MEKQLIVLKEELKKAIDNVENINQLNETKAKYLGKKSSLQDLMKMMPRLSVEERKNVGRSLNEFKNYAEELIARKAKELHDLKVRLRLEKDKIDVTLPGKRFAVGRKHLLDQAWQELEDIFIGLGYQIAEGPEIELDLYNFEMLNTPKGHPARDMQDSFYIDGNNLLRTQTSPVQIRTLLAAKGDPVKIVCPGKVYRRDNDDATHSHQFMQLEGLVVDTDITMADLKGTLRFLMKKLFGDRLEIRFRPSFFPFTEPSVEVEVTCFKCYGNGCGLCKDSGWIEVLGAGMVHPNVLSGAGYDPKKYQGFAFGMGIERVVMLRHGIDDIRLLYGNDPRFLEQF
ncbi:MAG: phenylalanine--tRNA ligase subunit alpha [Bacillota bacterium]|jgi:phenylalanyl-tRNA synthetase alpha chain|nr:phenylalanine--tRNA ligase subunit alpha [Bacillota bacterium]HOA77808.1 phenylalanine--tRNA ligase subunit alpha [Bacilli bacterium]HPZ26636.1 phenylalanine--tRNA ligase subunit alpha [Bacilli bacterium]HQC88958.1 phenylalanine--tRNA ligase subunit alpha [Bacilli bacterium]